MEQAKSSYTKRKIVRFHNYWAINTAKSASIALIIFLVLGICVSTSAVALIPVGLGCFAIAAVGIGALAVKNLSLYIEKRKANKFAAKLNWTNSVNPSNDDDWDFTTPPMSKTAKFTSIAIPMLFALVLGIFGCISVGTLIPLVNGVLGLASLGIVALIFKGMSLYFEHQDNKNCIKTPLPKPLLSSNPSNPSNPNDYPKYNPSDSDSDSNTTRVSHFRKNEIE